MSVTAQLRAALSDLHEAHPFQPTDVVVFGVSTSEVAGQRIGSAGSDEVAADLFAAVLAVQQQFAFQLAFQCCEHLNRVCVVEKTVAEKYGWVEVTVIPVRKAGGAMASYAYEHLEQPICVEAIQADAGIDIGDTWVGMHMKPVAVPVRSEIVRVGKAHLTMAYTRPKLVGGDRACYK